jgi:hypothetical protein
LGKEYAALFVIEGFPLSAFPGGEAAPDFFDDGCYGLHDVTNLYENIPVIMEY